MNLRSIIDFIEKLVPSTLQEDWDNSGIQIGFMDSEVNSIMTCLEVDEETVYEAIEKDVDLIVTHHPLIFGGIKNVTDDNALGREIQQLIAAGISIYSSHTPFDMIQGGNNDVLASKLGLENIKLLPGGDDICRVGQLSHPMLFRTFIDHVANSFNIDINKIRAVGELDCEISKVSICSGAGSEYTREACNEGCHVLITGDVKHHEALDALSMGLCIIDAGHYGTEKFFAEEMMNLLKKNLPSDMKIFSAETVTDPFVTV